MQDFSFHLKDEHYVKSSKNFQLWARGYAAFSAGEVTDKVIREYVTNHSDGTFTIAS